MKNKIIYLLSTLFILSIYSCKDDEPSSDTDSDSANPVEVRTNDSTMSGDMSIDSLSDSQPTNEDNTGIMPKINTSFYGKDHHGAEVTINFLPDHKFEMFTYKGNNENLIAGTYSNQDGKLVLQSSSGNMTLTSNGANEYTVSQEGERSYTVKQIN